ncbi:MAG: ATP-binding protein [Desulfovibrio sp.]
MFTKNLLKNGMNYVMSPDLGHVDKICKDVADFLKDRKLEKYIFETGLVVREAVCNGIVHGCKNDRNSTVSFRFEQAGNWLVLTVDDGGPGWDWKKHSGDLPENAKDSGRGLYIMKHYADEVKYNDKGNRLVIKKRIA